MESRDRKTKITFHSGVLTIGGTVIEIAYGSDRIFFDFGTEYRPELGLKDDSLESLLEYRLVPDLDIYDSALGVDAAVENTAVFLSHCHLDHTRMINYLDDRIPIYALQETKVLLEMLNQRNDFLIPSPKGYLTRPIQGVHAGGSVDVGAIHVKLMRVDHDAYGACGMLIDTPDLRIVYTGDLRLHGFDREATLEFCREATDCDVLIMEGVSISFEDRKNDGSIRFKSENDLVNYIVEMVETHPDIPMMFNGYEANVKRFAKIVEKVKQRSVVVEAKMAHILRECLHLDCYYYQEDNMDWNLDTSYRIPFEDLLNDTGRYLWQLTAFDERLQSGGVYLHCDANPVGAFDPAYAIFKQEFLDKGISFKHLGCSGHAFPDDLDTIIREIKPKLLVPIHTLKPELLLNPYGERYLPKRGETL